MGVKELLGVATRPKVLGVPVGRKRADWSQLASPKNLPRMAGMVAAGLASAKAVSWLVSDPPSENGQEPQG